MNLLPFSDIIILANLVYARRFYLMNNEFEFMLYKVDDEDVSINALVKDETIWLT